MIVPHCNIEKLVQGCMALALDLEPDQIEKMCLHLELLSHWNRSLNLTAVENMEDMVTHHLLDSLSIMCKVKGSNLLDVGSGAGFPGLPLALANPDLEVTLLDSRGKRIEFLRHVIIKTDAKNVSVAQARVEDFRASEKFDTLVARAFSSLDTLVAQSSTVLVEGTRMLAMKGKDPGEEISRLPKDVAQRAETLRLDVPFLSADRHLVIIDF